MCIRDSGVGVSCVNALSEWLRLTIRRNGEVHQMEFRQGERVAPLAVTGTTDTVSYTHLALVEFLWIACELPVDEWG